MVNKCLIAFVAAKIVQKDNVNVGTNAVLSSKYPVFLLFRLTVGVIQGVALYQLSELAHKDRPQ